MLDLIFSSKDKFDRVASATISSLHDRMVCFLIQKKQNILNPRHTSNILGLQADGYNITPVGLKGLSQVASSKLHCLWPGLVGI